VIRADDVRYPGADLTSLDGVTSPGVNAEERTLRPARDAGLALEGRRARQARLQAAQRRQRTVAGVLAVVALGALALGWQYSSDRQAKAEPLAGLPPLEAPVQRSSGPSAGLPVISASPAPADPTPLLASYRGLPIRLPVAVEDLTEVGFHQASYAYALRLKTKVGDANMAKAKKDRSTHRDVSKQQGGENAWLTGKVLRMWRARPGKPDTAIDVGADPGSPVYAPVTGTVVKVKRFKLYDRFTDVELHIQPDNRPQLDLVMIHLDDVSARPGDRVIAGVSRVAVVRRISKGIASQLRSYTRNRGYHTHLQLNDATDPRYKGLEGAITASAGPTPAAHRPSAR